MVYSGGRYVNYRYNAEGSLAELDYGEGDAAPTATYRFEYDSLGRLIRSQQRDSNILDADTRNSFTTLRTACPRRAGRSAGRATASRMLTTRQMAA